MELDHGCITENSAFAQGPRARTRRTKEDHRTKGGPGAKKTDRQESVITTVVAAGDP